MKSIEKAKLALRKHLLENKERVAADLEDMRKKSKGHDIFQYLENVSSAFSFENVFPSTAIYECSYDQYEILDYDSVYPPPKWEEETKNKKDSEILTESFFFDIIASC